MGRTDGLTSKLYVLSRTKGETASHILKYQELFAICQSLPGPASTKMVFYIALIHAGILPAIFAFALWSLPGAVGMYALALGVQKMPERLPPIVYALLSGLNASTVGIIALAAMKVEPGFLATFSDTKNYSSSQRRQFKMTSPEY